jgi:hypothetical protein
MGRCFQATLRNGEGNAMNQAAAPVPRESIDRIIAKLERLMDDARAQWSLPKSDNEARFYA